LNIADQLRSLGWTQYKLAQQRLTAYRCGFNRPLLLAICADPNMAPYVLHRTRQNQSRNVQTQKKRPHQAKQSKRLFRAKEKLRLEKVKIEFPNETEINQRLEIVLTTLYLLFNEGYYSESQDSVLRDDLCTEATRLTYSLIENEQTNLPEVNALFALMCFHSSRFEARKNENGEIILYQDQDESLWDEELIAKVIDGAEEVRDPATSEERG